MQWKKNLLLISLLALLSSFSRSNKPESFLRHRFIVLPSSSLAIHGKTNVNQFVCAIAKYCGSDTLIIKETPRQKPVIQKGFVGLEASTFDCGMGPMTHDFNKTLKADMFPIIGIDFRSFERVPDLTCTEDKFNALVAISMAGVTKDFYMPCVFQPQKSGVILLKGERNFTFGDFNLKAPQRMMGLIKVDERLNVSFNLALKIDGSRW
ncbi:MAG: hypothetical protein ACK5SJ_05415 [Bacteroidota bacterium]|jgi:hypothetical protein|nr:hypothetical protein [Cytophagales bacterium]